MKKLITFAFILLAAASFGQTNPKSHVTKGYEKKNGTYVNKHRDTNPNKTQKDNYSAKGNVNPGTGKKGTKKAKK